MSLLHAPGHLLTVEEYEELGRSGYFAPGDRVELLNGQIIPMSPIGYRHATAVSLLTEFFVTHGRRRYLLACQNPFNLDRHSQPEPDLTLLDRSYMATRRHPESRHIFLVVEVSDSTVVYDRKDKGPAYALQGIREYWLLNLEKNVLEIYLQPEAGKYREIQLHGPNDLVAPLAFPDLVLKVGDFLP